MSRARLFLVLAVLAILFGLALPNTASARRAMALRSAADEVRSILLNARVRAAERGQGVAVRFAKIEGVWHYVTYDDGDGDGVRVDDIREGIDPPAAPPRPVLRSDGRVAVSHVNDPALCLFAPDGSASPCVIAIANGGRDVMHVTQRGLS